jgi:histidine triad (HIT) family protein
MYNNAPHNYICPICIALNGSESEKTWIMQGDIVYRDDLVTAFIGSKSIKGNECHPLVVPNDHYENLYDLPIDVGHRISELGKRISIALKEARSCDGVTLIQNNEPAGDQHAYHYHLHVIPRFNADNFHEELWRTKKSDPVERAPYAKELRIYFENRKK